MPDWTAENPMRVVTGYHNIARRFFAKHGFKHVVLMSADGALEAAPAMGSADIILDLVGGARVGVWLLPWSRAVLVRSLLSGPTGNRYRYPAPDKRRKQVAPLGFGRRFLLRGKASAS
jgi:hypothetical protein